MEIKGFIDHSLVDWDGHVSAVIFLPNCNFRCPFCYNVSLVLRPGELGTIPFEIISECLAKSRWLIDGVVITGGEPTMSRNLPELCASIKEKGFLVKLDTNGTDPSMIEELVRKGLVDYVAMDIKAPLKYESYSKAAGMKDERLLSRVVETMNFLLKGSVDYEFRTTLVPTIHDEESVKKICSSIAGCKRYVLQPFKSGVETIDPTFRSLKPFSHDEMLFFLKVAKEKIPSAVLRGYPSPYP